MTVTEFPEFRLALVRDVDRIDWVQTQDESEDESDDEFSESESTR